MKKITIVNYSYKLPSGLFASVDKSGVCSYLKDPITVDYFSIIRTDNHFNGLGKIVENINTGEKINQKEISVSF